MGFQVADGFGVDLGAGQGFPDDGHLAFHARGGVAGLAAAVVVDRRAFDHGPDGVALGQGVIKPFENHDPGPVAEGGAVGPGVERPAAAVRGPDHAVVVQEADALGHEDGRAAGHGHVRFTAAQALAGQMGGHQGGGAGGLDGDARAFEVELVGNPGGQIVLVVADEFQKMAGIPGVDVGHRGQAVKIGAQARSGVDAGAGAVCSRGMAGTFQGFPGTFQKNALLRIKQGGFLGGKTEKGRVEPVDVVDDAGFRNVGRVLEKCLGHAVSAKRLPVEGAHRGDAAAKVVPELVDVPGSRKAAGHADDCDGLPARRVVARKLFHKTLLRSRLRACRSCSRCAPVGEPGRNGTRRPFGGNSCYRGKSRLVVRGKGPFQVVADEKAPLRK